jgi:CRP/FNR family cyclic AMP-dependent transcriptional regulator
LWEDATVSQPVARKGKLGREVVVFRARKKRHPVDWGAIIARISGAKTVIECGAGHDIFRQGQAADSVFYLRRGKMKLTVVSRRRKEAIVCTLESGDFFGEGCLVGQRLRIATASAITDCILDRLDKQCMARMVHEHHDVSEFFLSHLLERNSHYEQDLVHQFFNSIEKRLAGTLLKMADFGKKSRSETVVPSINQEDLAKMVGTTRSRVSQFMNKFKMLGFVDYAGSGALKVNSGLLSVVLSD